MSGPAVPEAQVDDANDLRGAYFGMLIRRPLTLGLLAAFAIAAGVAGLVFVGPLVGLAGLGAAIAVGLIVVFGDRRLALRRHLLRPVRGRQADDLEDGRRMLPPETPLLNKGR